MPEFNATKYANEYIAKNYDRLSLAFPGGSKARFQAHIDEHRDKYKSITDFLYQAANAQIDRDNGADEAFPAPSPTAGAEKKAETLEELISRKRAEAAEENAKANGPSELMKEALAVGQKRKEAADQRREAARERDAAFREAMAQEKPAAEVPDIGAMMAGLGASLSERAQTEDEGTEENAE